MFICSFFFLVNISFWTPTMIHSCQTDIHPTKLLILIFIVVVNSDHRSVGIVINFHYLFSSIGIQKKSVFFFCSIKQFCPFCFFFFRKPFFLKKLLKWRSKSDNKITQMYVLLSYNFNNQWNKLRKEKKKLAKQS